jgi:hypothetical protein
LTLRPATPVEAAGYDRWHRLAPQVSPRAVFDAGHHKSVSFADNLAACEYVVSTSVAEGFGMAYLEPWLAHRAVVARRLPEVMNDFAAEGVDMPALYDELPVPGDADWLQACGRRTRAALADAWSSVPPPFRPPMQHRQADRDADTIDFATLTPADQADVLRRVADSDSFDQAVRQRSPQLIASLHRPADHEQVLRNAARVGQRYSPEAQGTRLRSLYRSLLEAPIERSISGPNGKGPAVQLVSEVRPFYPCRTERLSDEQA